MSPIFGVLLVLPQITGPKKNKTKQNLRYITGSKILVFTIVNFVGPIFSVPRLHVVNIELQEQQQDKTIEHGIEDPGAYPMAPTFEEMQQQHSYVADKIATQQQDLTVEHERKARAGQPDCGPEPVPVYDGVNRRR